MSYYDRHEGDAWGDVARHFSPDVELLDIGCGTGWLAEHFTRYTGVDGSAEAVAIATAQGRHVLEHDAGSPLPFADRSFDAVVMKDLLEHVADPVALVREARRVLRPGGLVFASSPDAQRWVWDDYTHRRPFTRRSYRLLFADQGFEVERLGYQAVVPGAGLLAGWNRHQRRPAALTLLAQLPFVRRNLWLLARTPRG